MDNLQQDKEQGIGTMSRSMLIVIVFTMISKVAGFLRETVLASQFGASALATAYKTAQNLPIYILMIVVTALSATLIPVYNGRLREGKAQANRFMSNLYTVGLVLTAVLLVLTGLFLEPLANFLMMGTEDMETRQLVVDLSRTMLPMGLFVFLTRISNAYLQANGNFTTPSISLIFLNLTVIASIMLSRGTSIAYVAIGTVLGWALQFAVQLPAIRRTGLAYRPTFDFNEKGLREVMVLVLPVLLASCFDQMYDVFDKKVAFLGDIGDPAKLDYAIRLTTMISSVLLTTIATVLYPNLVKRAGDREGFSSDLSFGVNLNLMIALPAMAAMILLCTPIIRIVYGRGEFTPQDVLLTAPLLACYGAGTLGIGLRELCNRCFFAFKNTIVPTVTGIGIVVLNVVLNYALHPFFGPAGIAAATAISTTACGVILLVLLHVLKRVVDWRRIGRCLWKTGVATAVMSAAVFILYRVLDLGQITGMPLYAGFLACFAVGLALYVAVLLVLRTEELSLAIRALRRRLRRA